MSTIKNPISIILVSTGCFQSYITCNIRQLIYLKYNVVVITERCFFDKLEEFHSIKKVDANEFNLDFDNKSRLDKIFREGFWHNCSKRLFLINEFMKKYNFTNCIHLENDVLLYYNFDDYIFDNKLYLTLDANDRCIPGIMYIPDYTFMEKIITDYNYGKNDMENLAIFYHRNKDICSTFPIIKKNKHYDANDMYNENYPKFNGIFDAAAIGQYLGGVDPRNISGDTIGFINETCVVRYSDYSFVWKGNEMGHIVPYVIIENEEIPVFNLHIHCKDLKKFTIN